MYLIFLLSFFSCMSCAMETQTYSQTSQPDTFIETQTENKTVKRDREENYCVIDRLFAMYGPVPACKLILDQIKEFDSYPTQQEAEWLRSYLASKQEMHSSDGELLYYLNGNVFPPCVTDLE